MKKKNLIKSIFKIPKIIAMQQRIIFLECEVEVLQDTIKDELYKTFMEKLKEPTELARYKRENQNLRAKVKTLKSLLKGDKK